MSNKREHITFILWCLCMFGIIHFISFWGMGYTYTHFKNKQMSSNTGTSTNLSINSKYLGEVIPTSYRSVRGQTDDSPYWTASSTYVHPWGVAVSRDLLTKVEYGDILHIQGIGFKVVNDTMNIRHKRRIDIWVSSYKEEKEFHQKWKGKKTKIWLLEDCYE